MGELLPARLPVHGFVLAGGKSSRMGEDKALLRFCGRPMVEIAVEKLRGFCAEVTIAGNREDLGEFAPVVRETRVDVGPAAGIEAGLMSASEEWALFMPVDVPLIPKVLLRRWAEAVLRMDGLVASNLHHGRDQPAFCMLRRDCKTRFSEGLDAGERRLGLLLGRASEGYERTFSLDMLYEANDPGPEIGDKWFMNVNTPEDLAEAEGWARAGGLGGR
jgi:molybdopterin-guanine dinucleotide biosynthesis protein A